VPSHGAGFDYQGERIVQANSPPRTKNNRTANRIKTSSRVMVFAKSGMGRRISAAAFGYKTSRVIVLLISANNLFF